MSTWGDKARFRPALLTLAVLTALPTVTVVDANAAPARPAQWDRPLHEDPSIAVGSVPVKGTQPDPAAPAVMRGELPMRWPGAAVSLVDVPPTDKVQVGATPFWVGRGRETSRTDNQPSKVAVDLKDQGATAAAGVKGLLFTVRRADDDAAPAPVSLAIDYAGFRNALGGDWSSRLRISALPACVLTTPDVEECQTATPLPSDNDVDAARVTAEMTAAGDAAVFAVGADTEGAHGDYKATPLNPSAKWEVSANGGSFNWSYPFDTPGTPGGLEPTLSLGYSSAALDGRTAASNTQASWAGDGFDVAPGFITRSYRPCADKVSDVLKKTGEQCWDTGDYVSISFGGSSGGLIPVENNRWRPERDDGSWVERIVDPALKNGDNDGEHWKVTTADGTQYFFGSRPDTNATWYMPVVGDDKDEPCHVPGDYSRSGCDQGWRWNLDHVRDKHGNTMTYRYETESNHYGFNKGKEKRKYVRSGVLRSVHYGTREGSDAKPLAQVWLDTADRCAPGADCSKKTLSSWPDVPWDQDCSTPKCKDQYSPTFWSSKRLAKVTTEVLDGTGYRPVDTWELGHTYLKPGDHESAALWLESIKRTGHTGTSAANPPVSMPAVTFHGTARANRIERPGDGLPPLLRHRISAIHNETGGVTHIKYLDTDCGPDTLPKPESNDKRCFPVRWGFMKAAPRDDWFTTNLVERVVEEDRVGGGLPQVTTYQYHDGAAWRYDDNQLIEAKHRTWNQWRGYGRVTVVKGDRASEPHVRESKQEFRYYRGMDGDRAGPSGGTKKASVPDSRGGNEPDLNGLAGFLREEITYNGDEVLSSTLSLPWRQENASGRGGRVSVMIRSAGTSTRTPVTGGHRTTETSTKYDRLGFAAEVSDLGDTAPDKAADDRCVRTTYSHNENQKPWILGLASRVETFGVTCSATAQVPRDAMSDVRTYYDDKPWGTAPVTGNVTRVEHAVSYDGTTPTYRQSARSTYDAYGRVVEAFDGLDHRTATVYKPDNGLLSSTEVTNPVGVTTTTTFDTARGSRLSVVDGHGVRADFAYDSIGRLTEVWQPGRSKAANQGGQIKYRYAVNKDTPSFTETIKLTPNESYVSSFGIADGFGRPRQTQLPAPGPGNGRVVSDTFYDSRGQQHRTNSHYYNGQGAPGGGLVSAEDRSVPSRTVTEFDGAGRTVAEIAYEGPVEKARTTTQYSGDRTLVIPPAGGTTKARYTDAAGKQTELHEFPTREGSGTPLVTKYAYDKSGQLAEMTDPKGNVTSFKYDLVGNKVLSSDPSKGVAHATYDAKGRQETLTDARGQRLTFRYNELDQRTEVRSGPKAETLLVKSEYDRGRLTSMTRYADGKEYTISVTEYDPQGRPRSTETRIPETGDGLAGTYRSVIDFTANGVKKKAYASALGDAPAETVLYGYDGLGNLKTVAGAAPYVTDTSYTRFGEVSRIQQGNEPNHVWHSMYYDSHTRRLKQTWLDRQRTTDIELESKTYGYDPIGNVTKTASVSARGGTDVQCFTHDAFRRTKEAWTSTSDCAGTPGSSVGGAAPYWTSYDYDELGNRTLERQHGQGGIADTVRTYDYRGEGKPNAVRSVTVDGPGGRKVDQFRHNEIGATTSRPGVDGQAQTLEWDAQGELGVVNTPGGKTTYVYAPGGERLITRDATGATLHLADGELRFDKTTGTKVGTRYYLHEQRTVAVRTGRAVHYQSSDRQGTGTVALASDSLEPTWRRLDPFGRPRQAAAFPGNREFVGGTKDASTGLTRLGARDYDPVAGQFLEVDPVIDTSDPQQQNAMSYSKNNPATFQDASGTMPVDCYESRDCYRDNEGRYHQTPKDEPIGLPDANRPPVRGCGPWLKACSGPLYFLRNPWACTSGVGWCPRPVRNPYKYRDWLQAKNDAAMAQRRWAAALLRRQAAEAAEKRAKADAEAWEKFKKMITPDSGGFCGNAQVNLIVGAEAEGCVTADKDGLKVSLAVKGGVTGEVGAGVAVKAEISMDEQTKVQVTGKGPKIRQTGLEAQINDKGEVIGGSINHTWGVPSVELLNTPAYMQAGLDKVEVYILRW